MRFLDLTIAGEFLVIAATLVQIKSKLLLPAEENPLMQEEEQLDPREELLKKLLEYQKFKEMANNLRQLEAGRQNEFRRPKTENLVEESQEVFFEASLFDLITAFSKALKDVPKDIFLEVIKDDFTVDEKIHQLLHLLLVSPLISLGDLFSKAKNKMEIVATFLAILELIRLKEINIKQREVFGEIVIARNSNNIEPYGRRTAKNISQPANS
jgi:segregation and condensation protein A